MVRGLDKTELLVVQNVERLPAGFSSMEADYGVRLDVMDYRNLSTFRWEDHRYQGVILSGTDFAPHLHPELFEDEQRLVRGCPVPALAICGGFQVVCSAWGGTISDTAAPIYGRTHVRVVREDPLWAGLPRSFCAFSKHRYAVRQGVPDFEVTACSDNGEFVYAIRHKSRPIRGVQFHPERRHDGTRVMANFIELVRHWNPQEDSHA